MSTKQHAPGQAAPATTETPPEHGAPGTDPYTAYGNQMMQSLLQARDAASVEAGTWLEWGIESYVHPTPEAPAPEPEPPAPPPPPLFEVRDPDARIRTADGFKCTADAIPEGTLVEVLAAQDRYVKVRSHDGAIDGVWTAASNLGTKPVEAPLPPQPEVEAGPENDEAVEVVGPDGQTYMDTAWEYLESTKVQAATQGLSVARWLTGAAQQEAREANAANAAQENAAAAPREAAPPDAAYTTPFRVVAPNAIKHDAAKTPDAGGAVVSPGTEVWILAVEEGLVHISTLQDQATTIEPAHGVWIASGALGGFGGEVALGNALTDEQDAEEARDIASALPEGRNPGASPYAWRMGSDFRMSLDGISLDKDLIAKLHRLCEWAIQNDMVTGDIVWGSGMRSPAVAHRMCVAWEIRYGEEKRGTSRISQADLEALPGGSDADGNTWWQPGWTWEDAKANAESVRSSDAIAAAGYPGGHAKRAPLPDTSSPGVSRHCSGGAVDVTIPWRAAGKAASTNATDVWGWENIYQMFGLYRALPKGHKFAEHWHIQSTDKVLNDEGAPPEPEMS